MINTRNYVKSRQRSSTDYLNRPIYGATYIAGADVGFENSGAVTRAAIVVMHYPSFEIVEYQIAVLQHYYLIFPDSFHSVSVALLEALQGIKQNRNLFLLMVKIAHP